MSTGIILNDGTEVVQSRSFKLGSNLSISYDANGLPQIDAGTGVTSHVLADTSGLGTSHTTSGLTAGQVLRATGATTAAFQAIQAGDLPAHAPQAHQLDSATYHTVSGLTPGHFLKATAADAFGFAAHGLTYTDVGAAASGHDHDGTYVKIANNTQFTWNEAADWLTIKRTQDSVDPDYYWMALYETDGSTLLFGIAWDGTIAGSGAPTGGAPTDADYLVRTANGSLSAERVVTNTTSIAWDWGTAGQAKADVQYAGSGGLYGSAATAARSDHSHDTVPAHSLEDHDDVTVATPSIGHVLKYVTTPSAGWENAFVAYSELTGVPSSFTPSTHASSHHSGGGDPLTLTSIAATCSTGQFLKGTGTNTFDFGAHGLTYSDVGAAASSHNQAASTITASDFGTSIAGTSYRINLPDAATVPAFVVKRGGASATGYTYAMQVQTSAGGNLWGVDFDGNVTATSFVGSGASLTSLNPSNLSSAVPVTKGGTGQTSFTNWRLLLINGSGAFAEITLGASGTALVSNGASSAPTFQTVSPTGAVLLDPTGSQTIQYPAMTDANYYVTRFDSDVPTGSPWSGVVAVDYSVWWENGAGGPSDPYQHIWRQYTDAVSTTESYWRLYSNIAGGGYTQRLNVQASTGYLTVYSRIYASGGSLWSVGSSNPYLGLNDGTYTAYVELTSGWLRAYSNGREAWAWRAIATNQNRGHVRGQWAHWDGSSGASSSPYNIGNSSTSFTFNADNGNIQDITNTGTVTSITWSNLVEGSTYVLVILAGSGAGSSWTWGSTVKWGATSGAPTLPTTSGYRMLVTMYYDGTYLLASATEAYQ